MKKSKIFSIIMILLLVTAILMPSFSFAAVDYGKSSGIDFDKYKGSGEESTELKDKAETIIGIISTIGIVVSVIALIAIGIKYMLGSIEEKAEYKKTLIPYIIGAFLVFTISLVPEVIYQIMKNLG